MLVNYEEQGNQNLTIDRRALVHSDDECKITIGSSEMRDRAKADITSIVKLESKEAIFNNKAELKISTSLIAMHLKPETKDSLFRQLDELLDEDEINEEDCLISIESFKSFLGFLGKYSNMKTPALNVTNSGNIASSWFEKDEKISVEYFESNNSRAVTSVLIKGKREIYSFLGHISALKTFFDRNKISCWIRKTD